MFNLHKAACLYIECAFMQIGLYRLNKSVVKYSQFLAAGLPVIQVCFYSHNVKFEMIQLIYKKNRNLNYIIYESIQH